jgi:alcohol dehydrogenase
LINLISVFCVYTKLETVSPDFETLAENSMKDACAGANPVFFDKELLIKLFKKIA